MDEKLHDSAADGLPSSRSDPESPAIDLGRRQTLLKSAASSGPLFMALAPGAAMAASSALRAAINDANQIPSGWSSSKDTWIRVLVTWGVVTSKSGNTTTTLGDGYMTTVGTPTTGTTVFYVPTGTTSGSTLGQETALTANNANSNGIWMTNAGTRYVLVLFNLSSQTPVGTPTSTWPQYAVTLNQQQALHCSSWSSIGPGTGTPPYAGC